MDYPSLFKLVRRHVEGLGIACEVVVGKFPTDNFVATIEDEMQIRLPAELREFYQTIGNGFSLRWDAKQADNKSPSAYLLVPGLGYLAELYGGWRGMALYSSEEAEKYGFPHTKDPALAKRTAARMWNWLPVIEEGNGDIISLDLSDPSCPVIFDKHDWLDGGPGDNGHHLAANWKAFLMAWGSVCFQDPKSLYWPSCFRPGGGVAWDGEEFQSPFRIDELAEFRKSVGRVDA